LSLKMFGRQQWTLFADFLLTLRIVPQKNICFDSRPYFRYSVVDFFVRFLHHLKYWHCIGITL
jgi:hypothetical protein